MRLGDALLGAPRDRALVVPYLLVDRRRRRTLSAMVGALHRGGASALELGFPFSDPIADGPVLESAAGRALAAGTTWTDLLAAARTTSPVLSTAVMTYANPVWRRGLRRAVSELRAAGATGLIVPDLSFEESGPWRRAADAGGIDLVLMAAPGASRERVRGIARAARGFLYLVSRYGTTGAGRREGAHDLAAIVGAARAGRAALPVLIGFGVRDRSSARAALSTGADGVIVGTALEEKLDGGMAPDAVARWLRTIATLPRTAGRMG